jgi:hypothetical protein
MDVSPDVLLDANSYSLSPDYGRADPFRGVILNTTYMITKWNWRPSGRLLGRLCSWSTRTSLT